KSSLPSRQVRSQSPIKRAYDKVDGFPRTLVAPDLVRGYLLRQGAHLTEELIPGVVYLNYDIVLRFKRQPSLSGGQLNPRPMCYLNCLMVGLDLHLSDPAKLNVQFHLLGVD